MENGFFAWLEENLPKLENKRAFLGFDGFVDIPISIPEMPTMKKLSEYLADRDGKSGAFEIDESPAKIGGNMPITANALGQLGLKNTCVGAVDSPMFSGMSKNCKLVPIAPPGKCYAIEFETGKLMLGDSKPVQGIDFEFLSSKVPEQELCSLHDGADLWCYLNWSELMGLTDVLRGILGIVLPNVEKRHRIAMFDLADFTSRCESDLQSGIAVMAEFGKYAETLITLNENEAGLMLKMFNIPETQEMEDSLSKLWERLGFNSLVVRKNRIAYAINKDGFTSINTKYVEKPKLMTGAGDNFNAGIAAALVVGGNFSRALELGTTVSSFYIANGYSPSFDEIMKEAAK